MDAALANLQKLTTLIKEVDRRSIHGFNKAFNAIQDNYKDCYAILILLNQVSPYSTIALGYLSDRCKAVELSKIPSGLPQNLLSNFWQFVINLKDKYSFNYDALVKAIPKDADADFYLKIFSIENKTLSNYVIQVIPESKMESMFNKIIQNLKPDDYKDILHCFLVKSPRLLVQFLNTNIKDEQAQKCLVVVFDDINFLPTNEVIELISNKFLLGKYSMKSPLLNAFIFSVMRKMNLKMKYKNENNFIVNFFSKVFQNNNEFKKKIMNHVLTFTNNKTEFPSYAFNLCFNELPLDSKKLLLCNLMTNKYTNSLRSAILMINNVKDQELIKDFSFVICCLFIQISVTDGIKRDILSLIKSLKFLFFDSEIMYKTCIYYKRDINKFQNIFVDLSNKSQIAILISIYLSKKVLQDYHLFTTDEFVIKIQKENPNIVLNTLFILTKNKIYPNGDKKILQKILIKILPNLSNVKLNEEAPLELYNSLKGITLSPEKLSEYFNQLLSQHEDRHYKPPIDYVKFFDITFPNFTPKPAKQNIQEKPKKDLPRKVKSIENKVQQKEVPKKPIISSDSEYDFSDGPITILDVPEIQEKPKVKKNNSDDLSCSDSDSIDDTLFITQLL